MKRLFTLFVGIASIVAAAILISGCPAGSNANPPSTADTTKAFTAMTTAQTTATSSSSMSSGGSGSATFSNPSGTGSVLVTFSTTGTPPTRPYTVTGTLVFTNWYDASSGYTINGTLAVTISMGTVQITDTVTGNLTFSGGAISTLTCNITETTNPVSVTGTITVNGFSYDVTKL